MSLTINTNPAFGSKILISKQVLKKIKTPKQALEIRELAKKAENDGYEATVYIMAGKKVKINS